MPEPQPRTALVVGALSRDLDPARRGDGEGGRPGGTVHYAGLALARLGLATRVVTSLAPEDAAELLAPLRGEGVEAVVRKSASTTTYRNDYTGEEDVHELLACSDPIGPADVPEAWRHSSVVQLGPLHRNDVLPELAAELSGLKGLDLQGLARLATPIGTRLAPCPELPRFLAHVSVVKASEVELAALLAGAPLEDFARRHPPREWLVTRGARGALVLHARGTVEIPATPVAARRKVGAGDLFLSAYLAVRESGASAPDAARSATRLCGAYVESGELPEGLPAQEEM